MSAPGPLIWGVKADLIKPRISNHKFYAGTIAAAIREIILRQGEWRHRYTVEEDPSFLQAIPYVVTTNTNTNKTLLMRRKPKQTEARLHGMRYIGLGGHIEQDDEADGASDILEKAAWREIKEETGFTTGKLEFQGIVAVLDPDAPPVNHVHIGVVYHLHTTEWEFNCDEKDWHDWDWVSLDEIARAIPEMELWAQVVCTHYLGLSV